jgi:hypothetical protein
MVDLDDAPSCAQLGATTIAVPVAIAIAGLVAVAALITASSYRPIHAAKSRGRGAQYGEHVMRF